ncbi:MAG: ATP-binding protein [Erysipelotrichaceae bacterium]|nr:ATP-binding protein [Erysipelotrichaceae bacterium]
MDARLIIQVIFNLLDNAIKYTPKDSVIEIKVTPQDQNVMLSVIDNGIGIPDENKPHIFDMFYTGNQKVADSHRSLGLGLALCKSIINSHHGTITVLDHDPHGSIFRITLPTKEVALYEE